MIGYDEIKTALMAVNPQTTPEQIQQYEQQIQDAFSDRKQTVMHELRTQWITHHKRQPDGLTWGQIVDAAHQSAEQQIRQEYLAELTEQVIQNQLNEVEDSPHLRTIQTPGMWQETPEDVEISSATWEILHDLWPDKNPTWYMYAAALIERMKHLNRPYPADWDSKLKAPFEKKIDQAIRDQEAKAGKPTK